MNSELYIKYYDLESYILSDVRENFHANGHLNAFDFFCIIIWKANRAKTKIAQRILRYNSNLEAGIKELTEKIYHAKSDKDKARVLLEEYEFRLPMSSAILGILYPENFTVYDIRVCETLTSFSNLDNLSDFEKKWLGYETYIQAVKIYGPDNISLRDKDRLLWGKSFYEQLTEDITHRFYTQT